MEMHKHMPEENEPHVVVCSSCPPFTDVCAPRTSLERAQFVDTPCMVERMSNGAGMWCPSEGGIFSQTCHNWHVWSSDWFTTILTTLSCVEKMLKKCDVCIQWFDWINHVRRPSRHLGEVLLHLRPCHTCHRFHVRSWWGDEWGDT